MKKQTGVWIDKREAKIFSITDSSEAFKTITSNIEEFHPKGGSGTRMKGGPQDVVQDSKYLEREKHQYNAFFKEIMGHLEEVDELVIFGPAQTGKKLSNEIAESYPPFQNKVKGVEKADNMTENQIKAWVKNYFS